MVYSDVQIVDLFSYHVPTPEQTQKYSVLRKASTKTALAFNAMVADPEEPLLLAAVDEAAGEWIDLIQQICPDGHLRLAALCQIGAACEDRTAQGIGKLLLAGMLANASVANEGRF